jgi:hypothetical protein
MVSQDEANFIRERFDVIQKKIAVEDKIFKIILRIKFKVQHYKSSEAQLKVKDKSFIEITDLPDELSQLLKQRGDFEIDVL